jgi:hypothetical protein
MGILVAASFMVGIFSQILAITESPELCSGI